MRTRALLGISLGATALLVACVEKGETCPEGLAVSLTATQWTPGVYEVQVVTEESTHECSLLVGSFGALEDAGCTVVVDGYELVLTFPLYAFGGEILVNVGYFDPDAGAGEVLANERFTPSYTDISDGSGLCWAAQVALLLPTPSIEE